MWLSGQTINIMTLGGLALAVGILVDEGVVEIENIDSTLQHEPDLPVARGVLTRDAENRGRPLPVDACHRGGVSFLRSS